MRYQYLALLFALFFSIDGCSTSSVQVRKLASVDTDYNQDAAQFAIFLSATIRSAPEQLWDGLDSSDLRFIVRDPLHGHAIFVNFPKPSIEVISSNLKEISDGVEASDLALPEIDFFTGCESSGCGENQTQPVRDELNKKLSAVTGTPLLIVNPSMPSEWINLFRKNGSDLREAAAFIYFHEVFHLNQQRLFANSDLGPKTLPDQTSCKKDEAQKVLFSSALSKWSEFLKRSVISPSTIPSDVRQIMAFYLKNPSVCLDSSFYRSEATANYFAFQILNRSKSVPLPRLIELVRSTWFNSAEFEKAWRKSYDPWDRYGIGFAMYYALSLLDPSDDWQAKANRNQSPFDALRSRAIP